MEPEHDFYIDLSDGAKLSGKELEIRLKERVKQYEEIFEQAVWDLVRFYLAIDRLELAALHFERLIDPEEASDAGCILYLQKGQMLEKGRGEKVDGILYYIGGELRGNSLISSPQRITTQERQQLGPNQHKTMAWRDGRCLRY